MSNKSRPETYIGDGVYASFDGYQIWLRTARTEAFGSPDRPSGDTRTIQHVIALEPSVFEALRQYAEGMWGGML